MKKIYLFLCFSIFSFALTAQTVNVISNPGTSGNIIIGGSP